MLTPQEIQNQKFERTAFGVRGYDMAQVDQFLDELFNDYSSLYKENAALKTKMRALVDKIEEYRAVDEEMRRTLYNAQVSAKDTVTRAQCEAERILQAARSDASRHAADLKKETARQEERLASAKRNNLAYVEKIRRAMEQSIRQLEQVMEMSAPDTSASSPEAQPAQTPVQAPSKPAQPEAKPSQPEAQTEPAVKAAPVQVAPETSAEANAPSQPAQEQAQAAVELELEPPKTEQSGGVKSDTARIYGDSPFTPKPRFDFTDMRFGRNYESSEDNK